MRSHVIEPKALRADNFDAFFSVRHNQTLDRIEQAMGKPIARDAQAITAQVLATIQAEPTSIELEDTA